MTYDSYMLSTHQIPPGFAGVEKFRAGPQESERRISLSDTGTGVTQGQRSHWWIQGPRCHTPSWQIGTQGPRTRLVNPTKGSSCPSTLYIHENFTWEVCGGKLKISADESKGTTRGQGHGKRKAKEVFRTTLPSGQGKSEQD